MAGVRIFVVVVFLRWMQLTSGSCQPGMFGDSCSYSCHCGTSCDEMTGVCSSSCDPGWRKDGVLCQKQNIALNKTASTTSGVLGDWYAAHAVDGDSDIGGESITCFHAKSTPSDWTVDLGRDFQLYDISIYSRHGFYGRNANSTIYLNNDTSSICSTLPSSSDTPNPTDVTCNGTGRYVTIRNSGAGGHDGYASALNICEVEIYVCSPGIYGVDCDKFCHCLDSTCDRLTGLCPGDCRPGWQGRRCDTECDSKHYGSNCLEECSSRNCDGNSSCNSTGNCDSGCLIGWTRGDCTECDAKHYGVKCNMSCSSRHCVKSSSCDTTGICVGGCEAGWTGDDCTERVATRTPSHQPEAETLSIAAVVGAVVGVMVILLLVLAVILIRRRRGKSHGRSAHKPVVADNVKPPQGGAMCCAELCLTGCRGQIPAPSGTNGQDYTELSEVTREREEKSQYDVIQNKVYENNQI